MKLSYQKFCLSPPSAYKAILFSSFEEERLASPLLKTIKGIFPNTPVLRLSAPEALDDVQGILGTLRSPSLFGPPPKLILDDILPSHLSKLKQCIEALFPTDGLFLTTSYLKSSSPLRVFFETTPSVFFTPIYTPNESQIQTTLKDLFRSYGHRPSEELLTHLAHVYTTSPDLIASELSPFCLLFLEPSSIELSHYISYAHSPSFDENSIIKACLLKQIPSFSFPEISSPIGFLRILGFHFQKLLEHKGTKSAFPMKSTLDMKPVYEKALTVWSFSELTSILEKLALIEINYKKQSSKSTLDLEVCLFPLAGSQKLN